MAYNFIRNKVFGTYPHASAYATFPLVESMHNGVLFTRLYGAVNSSSLYSAFCGREYDNYNSIDNQGNTSDSNLHTNSASMEAFDKVRNIGLYINGETTYMYQINTGGGIGRVALVDNTGMNNANCSYNKRLGYVLRTKGSLSLTYMQVYDYNGNSIAYGTFDQTSIGLNPFIQTGPGMLLPNNIIAIPRSNNDLLIFRIVGSSIQYIRRETGQDFLRGVIYNIGPYGFNQWNDYANGKVVWSIPSYLGGYYYCLVTVNSDGTFVENSRISTTTNSNVKYVDINTLGYINFGSSSVDLITYDGNNTITVTNESIAGISGYNYNSGSFIDRNNLFLWNGNINIGVISNASIPFISTNTSSDITKTSFYGNGNITNNGGRKSIERGICYKLSTIAGDPTTSDSKISDINAWYDIGSFSKSITGLTQGNAIKTRAYAINDTGTGYGTTLITQLNGFNNPNNAFTQDAIYTSRPASSGTVAIKISTNGGSTYSSEKIVTLGGAPGALIAGGTSDTWGLSIDGDEMGNAYLKVKIYPQGEEATNEQIYQNFNFAIPSQYKINGVQVQVYGYYSGGVLYIDWISVRTYYGTVPTPVIEGSTAYASNGRKAAETEGNGTGTLAFWDGSAWIAVDSGVPVDD